MNKLLSILLFLTFLFCGGISTAQIHIDANEDVGIGSSNTDDSKLKVENVDNNKGLYLRHSYSAETPSYGLYSDILNVGLGAKYGMYSNTRQNSASTNTTHGWYNKILPYGTGNGYGIENRIANAGTGIKYGYLGFSNQNSASSSTLHGVANNLRNYGTGTTIGYYNYIYPEGTGTKYGSFGYYHQTSTSVRPLYGQYNYLKNYGTGVSVGSYNCLLEEGNCPKEGAINYVLQNTASTGHARGLYCALNNKGTGATYGLDLLLYEEGSGTKYGFRNRVKETLSNGAITYGQYNLTYLHGKSVGYGIYNKVFDDVGSENTKYGLYNYIEDHEDAIGNRYGIYTYTESKGSGTNYALWSGVTGGGDYAGYFAGNVVVTGTMMDGTSDVRLKEKIEKLDGALAIITQLQPKSYHFKKDKGIPLPEGRQYGLIAQELERVMPDLVSEFTHPGAPIYKQVSQKETIIEPGLPQQENTSNSKQVEATDALLVETFVETKSTIQESTQQQIVGYEADQVYKTIDYKALIPVLVGGMQEQQAQIKQQEKQIQQLLNRIEQLEKN